MIVHRQCDIIQKMYLWHFGPTKFTNFDGLYLSWKLRHVPPKFKVLSKTELGYHSVWSWIEMQGVILFRNCEAIMSFHKTTKDRVAYVWCWLA